MTGVLGRRIDDPFKEVVVEDLLAEDLCRWVGDPSPWAQEFCLLNPKSAATGRGVFEIQEPRNVDMNAQRDKGERP